MDKKHSFVFDVLFEPGHPQEFHMRYLGAHLLLVSAAANRQQLDPSLYGIVLGRHV